ncbi:MAG: nuclear transport factor 2 family protein [Actinomycetota bacterium]|nr:nuclear transport factor 2 family protein [Actinomycetota bacterium]
MAPELPLPDRIAIHELAARYGNVIDARQWHRLEHVFSADATFELRGFEQPARFEGLVAIRAMLEHSTGHPVAHHVTNVEVEQADGLTTLFFKVIGPGRKGRVGSVDYTDIVRREPDGWRIVTHVATLRTAN